MKKIFAILFIAAALNAYAQGKAEPVYLYTFAGKGGDISMTWDEFSKCKMELITIDKSITIKSFNVSVLVINGKDSTYTDYANQGNVFGSDAIATLKTLQDKKIANKILIEEVVIRKDDKEVKVPGMVIKLN